MGSSRPTGTPGRYQRSTADGGKRLAAPPSADIQIIPKITQFLQTHARWDYGADEIAADLSQGIGRLGDAPLPVRHDRFAAGKRGGAFGI